MNEIDEKILLEIPNHKTQKSLADLFNCTKQNISLRIHNNKELLFAWKEHKSEIKFYGPAAYSIFFIEDSKTKYYGSTSNAGARLSVHLCELRHNNHGNKYLQDAFNKYGEKSLRLQIIKTEKNKDLLLKEEDGLIKGNKCYNINMAKSVSKSEHKLLKKYLYSENAKKIADKIQLKKSKYKYIVFNRRSRSWRISPIVNGKQIYVGYDKDEENAKKRLDEFLKKSI